jgi:hypothetical protein
MSDLARRSACAYALEDFGVDPPPPEWFTNQKGIEAFGSGGVDPVQPGDYIKVIDIEPFDWDVELNSPRKADVAKCTFPRSKFPVDPQIIRSLGLQIFCGAFTSRELCRGLRAHRVPGASAPRHRPPGAAPSPVSRTRSSGASSTSTA